MLKTLYTVALVLRQTRQWKLKLIVALVKLQALLLDCPDEFGITPTIILRTNLYVRVCLISAGSGIINKK